MKEGYKIRSCRGGDTWEAAQLPRARLGPQSVRVRARVTRLGLGLVRVRVRVRVLG